MRKFSRDTVKINTLSNEKYRVIQQRLIDALDQGEAVRIRGTAGNGTELTVRLHELQHPEKETNFENCVADDSEIARRCLPPRSFAEQKAFSM